MAANTQELQQELKDAIDGDNSERVLTLLDEHNPGIDAQIILASPAAIQHADAVLQAETLLQYAGRVGSKQVVEALIRRGAKVENEFTALFLPDHPIGALANPDLIARFKIIYDFAVEQQSANPGNNRIRALKTVNDLKALCKSFDASIDSFTPTPGVDPVSGTIKEERGKVAAHFVWDELKRFLDDSTHAGNPKEIGIEFLKRIALLPATIQLQMGFSRLQDFKKDKANAEKIEKIQVKPFGSGKVLTGVAALDYFSAAIYSAINGDHSVSAEMQQAILTKIKEIVDGENQA
ncbi:MAG: hypothetical protein K2Q33_05085, partial [Gammaproteobacteria bacterium]|nr:hypothetical protein [Gammaproteobacteria bacterium]